MTKRRRARALLAVVALTVTALATPLTLASASTAQYGSLPKPTIVLVHGAWADASSWAKVTDRLQDDGYPVLAAPNPLRGLSSDAAYLAAFLQQHTTGPIVLVGHSYGGAVIIDAFVPDQGETVLGLQGGGGDPAALFDFVQYPGAPPGDVDLYIKLAVFPQVFANDLPATTAAQLAASQRPITFSALLEPSGVPAWRRLPSWYLVGTDDHILPPAQQLFMAQRAHSTITRVAASHLSMLSEPGAVQRLIVAADRATN
jgi:pimeloyl-ACP methyl ester carboxylesterase